MPFDSLSDALCARLEGASRTWSVAVIDPFLGLMFGQDRLDSLSDYFFAF